MSTVLERAKAVQLDTANQTSIWIRLRLLQELIAEIERLELLVRMEPKERLRLLKQGGDDGQAG
jgi:hypothetical protein